MNNIPKLRFPEFTDAWEKCKLGEILIENLKPVDKPQNGYTRLGLRSHMKGTFHEEVEAGKGLDVDTMYEVEENNLILNITFAWEMAIAITNSFDKGKLVSHRFPQYKFSQGYSPDFFYYSIDNKKFKENLLLASPGGAGRNRVLKKSEFLKIEKKFPKSLDEQQKIGNLFKQLDRLITLHKRKWDDVILLKKALLQKMFPKNGSDFPEIRFPEFTDAWEKCKLGEVAEYRNGKAHEQNITENGKYIVINSKFISTDGEVKKFSDKQIEPLYKNEIVFVLSDVPNGRALAKTYLIEKDGIYTLNQRIAAISALKNSHPYFLQLVLNRNDYFLSFDSGVGQTNLSISDVMKFRFSLPPLPEQQKIGNLFKQLDRLVTLHKRQHEHYQLLKKALLQQMFV
ncbi:restriction endonuclease subunit S [Gallibacterium anatis]|uniref:restriction endonuclease subunit S n=1 Tax=Gallibacterium anatis TaxID=750 RepID=UPI00254B14B6|nr:restriction endonuclease subunit S [Gallibacterium anatis]WIM84381.1 restriction endonuclease subunit S [Gallibacterium anatis]